jgi:fructose-1,6-bisphosphatase/inositol monophosphatase family enzyme
LLPGAINVIDPDRVSTIVREVAESEVLPRFRALGPSDVREKGPGDLVTVADEASERELARRLLALMPGSVVLGEEAAARDPSLTAILSQDAPVWVLDPIDGTVNYARGRPAFGIIVALVVRGEVQAGWIHDPLENVTVTATRGGGAWCRGRRARMDRGLPLAAMTGSAYGTIQDGTPADALFDRSGRVGRVENLMCGATEYIALALGQRHFFLSPRSLPWDHAAGVLIVGESGGTVSFLDGMPYSVFIQDRPILGSPDRRSWQELRGILRSASGGAES